MVIQLPSGLGNAWVTIDNGESYAFDQVTISTEADDGIVQFGKGASAGAVTIHAEVQPGVPLTIRPDSENGLDLAIHWIRMKSGLESATVSTTIDEA